MTGVPHMPGTREYLTCELVRSCYAPQASSGGSRRATWWSFAGTSATHTAIRRPARSGLFGGALAPVS